jgi:hypothetical protein
MGSINSDLGIKHIEHDLVKFFGFVATDSNGDPKNANSSTPKDDFGQFLYVPKEIASITRPETGLYRFTLKQDWFQLRGYSLDPYVPRAQAQASLLGSVDLTGLTLSALNTQTLKLNATAGGLVTTTFTTPANIQGIADQINAAEVAGTKNARAEIITLASGVKKLRCYDLTLGGTSSLTCDATSSAAATLGVTTGTTPTGQKLGGFVLLTSNPWAKVVDFASTAGTMGWPAKTIDFVYQDGSGLGTDLKNGGFYFELTFKNTNVP